MRKWSGCEREENANKRKKILKKKNVISDIFWFVLKRKLKSLSFIKRL